MANILDAKKNMDSFNVVLLIRNGFYRQKSLLRSG